MPNPARMHHQSSKLEHFLGLADLYIQFGQPDVFEIEPSISDSYRPDIYMVTEEGQHVIIEYQKSIITSSKMQNKIDRFVESYYQGKHICTTMWIVSNFKYNHVVVPPSFQVLQIKKEAL